MRMYTKLRLNQDNPIKVTPSKNIKKLLNLTLSGSLPWIAYEFAIALSFYNYKADLQIFHEKETLHKDDYLGLYTKLVKDYYKDTIYQSLSNKIHYFYIQELNLPKFDSYLGTPAFAKYSELPVPSDLAKLYEDLVNGTGEHIVSVFYSIRKILMEHHKASKEVLRTLDDIRLIFELVKRSYHANTLNYEVYDDIEKHLTKLIRKLEEGKYDEVKQTSEELLTIFQSIMETNKVVKKTGTKLLTAEDTGKKIGEMRLFRIKKS